MSNHRDKYGPGIAMTDLATNLLGVFICLFMLSFLMMTKKMEEQTKKVESKAEFLITIVWDKDSNNDVDTYVEDPLGNLVFFRAREKGLMHLDRDDIGQTNDRVIINGEEKYTVKENIEVVTIRGIIPGEYVVNVHMYSKRDTKEICPIEVRVEKLNPALTLIGKKTVELGPTGQEITVLRFTLDNTGAVTSTNDLQKDLARQHVQIPLNYGNTQPSVTGPEGEQYPEYNPDGE